MFDDAGRQVAKFDPAPFQEWAASHQPQPPPLGFDRWDDARRVPFPGGPDRTDDLVAVLRPTDKPDAPPVYQIIEVQLAPEPLIFHRIGVYELLLAAEKQTAGDASPAVGTVLLVLTGEVAAGGLELGVPNTPMRHTVKPIVVNVKNDDATTTLAAIEAGRFGRCILGLVPLMKGGSDPALIEEWKRVALTEPDVERRRFYRDLALVFAELTRGLVNWQRAMEGWQMLESQYIKGYIEKGEQRGIVKKGRAVVLETLRVRFQDPVPESVRLAVEGTNDPETLDRWFKAALTANTLAEFRAAMPLDN